MKPIKLTDELWIESDPLNYVIKKYTMKDGERVKDKKGADIYKSLGYGGTLKIIWDYVVEM